MSNAPVCVVTTPAPPADPKKRAQLQQLPPNATLPQIIRTINNNFHFLNQTLFKNGNFVEVSRSTELARVTNPEDTEQYVDVLRINRLVLRDSATGATWTFTR